MPLTNRALRSVYQLKITLLGSQPEIWRSLQVASTTHLDEVHMAIQVAMGWANTHMHEFIKDHHRYAEPDEDGMLDVLKESDYRLQHLLKKEQDSLLYLYDYGDAWEHKVVLEKILPFTTDAELPLCVGGGNACPPEDVGGIPGYGMFLETIADVSDPEHDDMLEWVGGSFAAEHFDLVEVNMQLREHFS